MRQKSRFLALFLAVVMTLSVLTTGITIPFAKSASDPSAQIDVQAADLSTYATNSIALQQTAPGNDQKANPPRAGAEFTIKFYANKNDFKSIEEFNSYEPLRTWIIRTNEDGKAMLEHSYLAEGSDPLYYISDYVYGAPTPVVPLGAITVEETKAPEGYYLDPTWYNPTDGSVIGHNIKLFANCVENDDAEQGGGAHLEWDRIKVTNSAYNIELVDPVKYGGLAIKKYDLDQPDQPGQGATKIGSLTFTVYNLNNYPVVVDGESKPGNGGIVYTGRTNEDGSWESPIDWLPYGDYKVVEVVPPNGYNQLGGTFEVGFSINDVTEQQDHVQVDFKNPVSRGQIAIHKGDYDRDEQFSDTHKDEKTNVPQGNGSLAGAVYRIVYLQNDVNKYPITVDGKVYQPGSTLDYKLVTDADGYASTPVHYLPLGEYEVYEESAAPGYKVNPARFDNFNIIHEGETVYRSWGEDIVDPIIRGGIDFTKDDADLNRNTAQGDASLEGAQYTITNRSTNSVWVKDANGTKREIKPGEVAFTLTTNAQGKFSLSGEALPYGHYEFKEVKAPQGYHLNETVYQFDITTDGKIVKVGNDGHSTDTVIRGGFKVQKRDADTKGTTPQGDATLGGFKFEIVNNGNGPVYVNGKEYAPGAVCFTGTANADGSYQSAANLLPYGSYTFRETVPPTGYYAGDNITFNFEVRNEGSIYDGSNTISNPVQRYGLIVVKRDIESKQTHALGSATLAGGEYELLNKSAQSVYIDGKRYMPGEVIYKFVSDENGRIYKDGLSVEEDGKMITVPAGKLPYGTYLIRETKAPSGYLREGVIERTFSITENGAAVRVGSNRLPLSGNNSVVDLSEYDNSINNQVIRGDFSVRKIDAETQETMAGVRFRVTSLTTGESHEFTTNENGGYRSSSRFNPHSADTNGGNAASGMWFGQYTTDEGDVMMTAVNDKLGALPFDTYYIEELRCEANEGYRLWSDVFTVTRPMGDNGDDYEVNLNNIENFKYKLTTNAWNTDDHGKIVPAHKDVSITDTVNYEHLAPGTEYKLVSFLYNATTGELLKDANGEPVTVNTVFTPEYENGSIDVVFFFDATGIEGGKVVAYQFLYEGDSMTPVAKEDDPENIDQTVTIPSISTNAVEASTGYGVVGPNDRITIKDKVFYAGLSVGREYIIKGVVMDKATGEALRDADGNEITTETTFRAHSTDGYEELTFVVAGKGLAGKQLVVFETLYDYNGHEYCFHRDIKDRDQTVYVPIINETVALSAASIKNLEASDGALVFDAVKYDSLRSGLTYRVDGVLYDATAQKEITTGTSTFVPDAQSGTVSVTFSFDASELAGHKLVALEKMYVQTADGEFVLVASHEDKDDAKQTVYVPAVSTVLTDSETDSHTSFADDSITLNDVVRYESLAPNTTYTLKAILMNKETESAVLDKAGKTVTAIAEFSTGSAVSGEATVTFRFDGSHLKGEGVVAYEDLYEGSVHIAAHRDIEDDNQLILFPVIGTSLKDSKSDIQMSLAEKEATLIDTVTYENLVPGVQYTIDGVLVDQSNSAEVATGHTTFTPEAANGTVEVTFKVNTSLLKNHTVVAFETLKSNGAKIAEHCDIHDEAQSTRVPQISTSAVVGKQYDYIPPAPAKPDPSVTNWITVTSTVKYENLEPGVEYTITSTLTDPETGNLILDASGNIITASTTFVPDEPNGEVTLTYTFEAPVDWTADKEPEFSGYIWYELAETTKNIYGDKGALIVDTVTYQNLVRGIEYTVKGTLMDKSTGKPLLDAEGQPITAEKIFTANEANGTVDIEFMLDAGENHGKSVVVYEELYANNAVIAEHKDINDPAQTLYVPELDTIAVDGKTHLHMAMQCSGMAITDTVNYSAVEPGKDYVMRGTLMDKDTQAPLLDNDGNTIVVEKVFTATASKGTLTLEFAFENFNLAGKTVVVFEELLENNFVIGEHKDLNDEDQTVHIPKLSTSLVDDKTGMQITYAEDGATVTDTVTFANVIPGMIYQVRGQLVDAATGEQVATAKMNFRPEKANGSVTVNYTFDASKFAGRSVVAYEELYASCTELVARHQDINDPAQTVQIPSIDTVASSSVADTKSLEISASAGIKDVITYKNLIPNQTYTVTACLMDASTGEQLGDSVQASFVTPTSSGTATLTLRANTLDMTGKSIVMFETIMLGDKVVASHEDLKDADQTVTVPTISTSAVDKATGLQYTSASETLKVKDTVSYAGLQPGVEYTVTGYAVSKTSGAKISDDVSVTFKPVAAEGTVDVIIPVNASNQAGKDIVIFETLYEGNIAIVEHKDINDEAQTVHIASIATMALDAKTQSHMAFAESEMKLTDAVEMHNLCNGAKYELTTVLVNRTTSEVINIDGAESLVNTFTADGTDVTVNVDVTLNDYEAAGCDLVFYEYLRMVTEEGAVLMASHADTTDENQTVNVPFISTALIDVTTSSHQLAATKTVVTDTVTYKNLIPGETYVVTGKLVDKATGEDLLDDNGDVVTATETFVPESENGTVVVTFEVDGKAVASDALVCFETMTWNDHTIAVHQDINDEEQTVHVPRIKTVLHIDGDKNTGVGGTITIVDDIYYYNLLPGYTYRVNGVLMDKTTGEPRLDSMGNPYTGTTTFVASETGEGVEHVEFAVNTNDMADGATLVAFERLQMILKAGVRSAVPSMAEIEGNDLVIDSEGNGEIDVPVDIPVDKNVPEVGTDSSETTPAEPTAPQPTDPPKSDATPVEPEEPGVDIGDDKDLNNGDETVVVDPVEISTVANNDDGGKEIYAVSDARVIDTVSYKNLRVGENYKLISTLMDWATMEPVTDANGDAVVVTTEFKPEKTDGTVQVQFAFDATALNGGRVVVYQKLYNGKDLIASEEDILNKDQTVDVKFAFLRTEAKVGESKETFAEESTVITDVVTYEGLKPGVEYTLKGELYDFESVASIGVTAETKFTPNAESGSAVVSFTVDTSAMAGSTVVVFEDLYHGGSLVAYHRDITDAMQSVVIKTKPVEPAKLATELTANGKHEVEAGSVEMKDVLTYTGLEAGVEYVVSGRLVVKSTGEEIAYRMVPFIPNDSFGTVTVDFGEVDVSSYGDDDIVAMEVIRLASSAEASVNDASATDAEAVVVHEDINDAQQTVHIAKPAEPPVEPTLSTELTADGEHEIPAGTAAFVDELTYTGLEPGATYVVDSKLVLKSNGEEIAYRMFSFTAEDESGTVTVDFGKVNLSEYGSDAVVAMEVIKLEDSEDVVVSHTDMEDANQTVTFVAPATPDESVPAETVIKTELTDDLTGTHQAALGKTSFTDVIDYENLETGIEYTLTSRLVNRETGDVIATLVNKFTPDAESGTYTVKFENVDTTGMTGAIVAFETIELDGETVVIHEDKDDALQTVYIGNISTKLTGKDGSSKNVDLGKKVTVVDLVKYSNLIPGKTYTVKALLHDAAAGEGRYIAAQTLTFTPEKADGTFEITFVVDTSELAQHELVMTEDIFLDDVLVVSHNDMSDKDQTVVVQSKANVVTAVVNNAGYVAIGFAIVAVAVAVVYFVLNRKKRREP